MTPKTLRKLANWLEGMHYWAEADKLRAAADAWEADLGRFYDVGNALQNAGFMPLGNDYAASVDAMSKQLGAEIRLRDKSEANESRLQVESADLRKRLEAAEKGVLLAISEWSTWKDVLRCTMREEDWQETMDGLRAALAGEK